MALDLWTCRVLESIFKSSSVVAWVEYLEGYLLMSQRNLETLVEQLGLKSVVAMLAQICMSKADSLEATQGDLEGKPTDWRADGTALRAIISRLRN